MVVLRLKNLSNIKWNILTKNIHKSLILRKLRRFVFVKIYEILQKITRKKQVFTYIWCSNVYWFWAWDSACFKGVFIRRNFF
ncbi:hypothetical protein FSU_2383 [Fibrobacter succinogenes subsp. succinogenes S85]|uniref:Uncharacterized protein n=1 Tax=Fibrobacter succinogenes (strain ATCC 19169 / S85) TaxID=59374 RepID=D9S4Q7_FIBSS|nr:hypothetical protein FSU_2383 [Fibrobacter succinogenes subsp. succinogenes S85]